MRRWPGGERGVPIKTSTKPGIARSAQFELGLVDVIEQKLHRLAQEVPALVDVYFLRKGASQQRSVHQSGKEERGGAGSSPPQNAAKPPARGGRGEEDM